MSEGGVDARNGALGTQALRFNSCSESRLGLQLLYPRSIPAGFLRSSGMPVLVSSKIVAAEQTVLTKLVEQILSGAREQLTTLRDCTTCTKAPSSRTQVLTKTQQLVSAILRFLQGTVLKTQCLLESTRSFSRAETRSKNSASEIQSMNDDLSFDLDFLVQFSSE